MRRICAIEPKNVFWTPLGRKHCVVWLFTMKKKVLKVYLWDLIKFNHHLISLQSSGLHIWTSSINFFDFRLKRLNWVGPLHPSVFLVLTCESSPGRCVEFPLRAILKKKCVFENLKKERSRFYLLYFFFTHYMWQKLTSDAKK